MAEADGVGRFIFSVQANLNPLKLIEITRRIGREYSGVSSLKSDNGLRLIAKKHIEPELTLRFLQHVHENLRNPYPKEGTDGAPGTAASGRPYAEAYALSLSSMAYAQLLLGDLPACKKTLDECESLLATQDTVEPVVNAGYYGVAGDYHKVKADYGPYYKNALLYLACVDVDSELTEEDRKARAHDLCIAALLGENIYNFGELVSAAGVCEAGHRAEMEAL